MKSLPRTQIDLPDETWGRIVSALQASSAGADAAMGIDLITRALPAGTRTTIRQTSLIIAERDNDIEVVQMDSEIPSRHEFNGVSAFSAQDATETIHGWDAFCTCKARFRSVLSEDDARSKWARHAAEAASAPA